MRISWAERIGGREEEDEQSLRIHFCLYLASLRSLVTYTMSACHWRMQLSDSDKQICIADLWKIVTSSLEHSRSIRSAWQHAVYADLAACRCCGAPEPLSAYICDTTIFSAFTIPLTLLELPSCLVLRAAAPSSIAQILSQAEPPSCLACIFEDLLLPRRVFFRIRCSIACAPHTPLPPKLKTRFEELHLQPLDIAGRIDKG